MSLWRPQVANMLYLEAPAGVGYSYSVDKNYTTDDDQVGQYIFGGSMLQWPLLSVPCMTNQRIFFVAPLSLNLLKI